MESSLLAGIMGHNLCLDIFGGPSDDEARAGLPVHGEALDRRLRGHRHRGHDRDAGGIAAGWPGGRAASRAARSAPFGSAKRCDNPGGVDKPVGWTQHVTLGPPFLEKGRTQFRASVGRSRVFESLVRRRRLSADRRRFRVAARAAPVGRHRRSPGLHRRGRLERIYGSPDGSSAADGVLRRVRPRRAAGVRLRLAPRRFPVAGHLGREPEPDVRALEFPNDYPRNGVRRLAVPGNAGGRWSSAAVCSTPPASDGFQRGRRSA